MEAVQLLDPNTNVTLGSDNDGNIGIVLDDNVTIQVTGGGGSGGEQFLSYTPPSAQLTWTVPHNFHRRPLVSVFDPEGNLVLAEVQHLSLDVLSITFSVPFTGTAELT